MNEDLEKLEIGRQARVKGFRDLTSMDALVEALDGKNCYVSIRVLSLRLLCMDVAELA